jgi:hypothetical protein
MPATDAALGTDVNANQDDAPMTRIPIDDENDATARRGPRPSAGGRRAARRTSGAAQTRRAPSASRRPPSAGGTSSGSRPSATTCNQRLARATADFKNTQRRIQGEADQRVQYAQPVADQEPAAGHRQLRTRAAQDAAKVDAASILKGCRSCHDQWLSVLKQQQVNEIAPSPATRSTRPQHER